MSRREEVLRAALDLLDDVGLAALTMRRLADRLGVRQGAIYRHFDSKSALLDAMVEHMIAQVGTVDGSGDGTSPEGGWDDLLRAVAEGSRRMMLTHRDGALLVITHVRPTGSEAGRRWQGLLHAMSSAGIAGDEAQSAVDTVLAFTNGYTIEEQARDGFPQESEQRAWRDRCFRADLELILSGIRSELGPRACTADPQSP